MNASDEQPRSLVIERTFPHRPDKLWRALSDRELLAQWITKNDFEPQLARSFQFHAESMPHWDGIIHCKLLIFEPPTRIGYSWCSLGLESVVVFTLTPLGEATHLRMEQSGFRPDQHAAFHGAHSGWQRFLRKLEDVLTKERE